MREIAPAKIALIQLHVSYILAFFFFRVHHIIHFHLSSSYLYLFLNDFWNPSFRYPEEEEKDEIKMYYFSLFEGLIAVKSTLLYLNDYDSKKYLCGE